MHIVLHDRFTARPISYILCYMIDSLPDLFHAFVVFFADLFHTIVQFCIVVLLADIVHSIVQRFVVLIVYVLMCFLVT